MRIEVGEKKPIKFENVGVGGGVFMQENVDDRYYLKIFPVSISTLGYPVNALDLETCKAINMSDEVNCFLLNAKLVILK